MTRLSLIAVFGTMCASLTPALAQGRLWVGQEGTFGEDSAVQVAVDGSEDVYVAGYTDGSLGGASAGWYDAFLAKYSASGTLLWTRQLGTPGFEESTGVAVDGAGNVYLAGTADLNLGGTGAGGNDVFLAKYDSEGNRLWIRQFGTASTEFAGRLKLDSLGNAYICGQTAGSLGAPNSGGFDAFIAKHDAMGNLVWINQIGSPKQDEATGIAVDESDGIYITGSTQGTIGGPLAGPSDCFLAKFSVSGTLLWTRQFGSSGREYSVGVAVDGLHHPFVAGVTGGNLGGSNAGGDDTFLAKFDRSGNLLWTRQIGTSNGDGAGDLALDALGNAYISGFTNGNLSGSSAGGGDLFVVKFDGAGTLMWAIQDGTSSDDECFGVALDSAGSVYVCGGTFGNLGGTNKGQIDYFVARYSNSPCPADFNHDGFVTGDDFDSFSLAFIAGDLSADFDRNGFVTGDDFDAYVTAFEAGC